MNNTSVLDLNWDGHCVTVAKVFISTSVIFLSINQQFSPASISGNVATMSILVYRTGMQSARGVMSFHALLVHLLTSDLHSPAPCSSSLFLFPPLSCPISVLKVTQILPISKYGRFSSTVSSFQKGFRNTSCMWPDFFYTFQIFQHDLEVIKTVIQTEHLCKEVIRKHR